MDFVIDMDVLYTDDDKDEPIILRRKRLQSNAEKKHQRKLSLFSHSDVIIEKTQFGVKPRSTKSLTSLSTKIKTKQRKEKSHQSPYYDHPLFITPKARLVFYRTSFRHRVVRRKSKDWYKMVITNATFVLSKPAFTIRYYDSKHRQSDTNICVDSIEKTIQYIDKWMNNYEKDTFVEYDIIATIS